MKYCSQCGCENKDDAHFCRNCGEKLKDATEDVQNQAVSGIGDVKAEDLSPKVIVDKKEDSIVSKLFYKADRYTGELRIGKAKTISVAVFVLVFLYAIAINLSSYSIFISLFSSVIVGLIFAVPVYIVGYILGLLIDKLNLFV